MTDRRNFLKTSALASAALLVNSSANAEIKPNVKVNKPIVLSTWKFGLKCNETAWEILKNNGKALDAVEAGVMVCEADPNERSVGYGGRPDRD